MGELVTLASGPVIGDRLGPRQLMASREIIQAYVTSTGDESFARHAAAILQTTGQSIAPPTLFDRDLGTRLYRSKYASEYSLHARQQFEFRRPIEEGLTYTITGTLARIFTRNDIEYAALEASCIAPDGEAVVVSTYTRAFRFPANRYQHASAKRARPTVASFLADHHARPSARFPEAGSVVEGQSREITQPLMTLYSGPDPNIHTDRAVAQARGHPDTIVQGLMATALECELYRQLFGTCWYLGGQIDVKYIANIMRGSRLTARGIVIAHHGGRVDLRTAVANDQQEILTVGTVSAQI